MNYWKRDISNPIRGLTLDRLSAQIDSFQNGYLAEFALTAEAMEQRDDMLKNVITKRKKAVTRHGWEILVEDCSDEARRQRDALDFFYRNLTCTHALRPNERGGFQLLIYQMMDAVGKIYAVHEILWKPIVARSAPSNSGGTRSPSPTYVASDNSTFGIRTSSLSQNGGANVHVSPNIAASSFASPSANSSFAVRRSHLPHDASSFPNTSHFAFRTSNFVTAQFRFVPLWYFEATTGPLRFLTTPGSLHGQPMAERDWLVTTGDALMIACSRAFLFKHYPLQAWLDFSEKFGLPGVRAITSAARGTPEFAEMEDALQSFMKELSVVTNTAESIDVIDLKGSGQPPFPELVERMDRVMASLWRGADLSTLSRDRGYGATLQEQESRILELDDARALSDHLNSTLDRWVLEQLFGPTVTPLARVKILVTPQECTPHDLQIDQFLIAHGARLPLSQTLERYGRVQAKPEEPALSAAPSSTSHSPKTGGANVPVSPNVAAHSAIDPTRVPLLSIADRHLYSRSERHQRGNKLEAALGTQSEIENVRSLNLKPSTFNLKPNIMTKLHNSTIAQSSPIGSDQNSSFAIRNSKFVEPSPFPNDSSSSVSDSSDNSKLRTQNSNLDSRSERLLPGKKLEAALGTQFETVPLDGFVQLSPLGLFPHTNGFQNVDRTALETLVKNFKSFFGRLGRRFAGLPFYIGHPDVPGYENVYSDRKAYGWIMDLEVREDGLYGRTNWSAAGRELISNGHFKFLSPYWEAIRIGERNGRGVFSPTVLKSVGLTNEPNLPVLPLANTNNTDCEPADHNACLGTSISLHPIENSAGATLLRSPNIAPVIPNNPQEAPEKILSPFSLSAHSTIDHDARSAQLVRGNTSVADLGGQNRHLESRSDQLLEGNKLETALGTQSEIANALNPVQKENSSPSSASFASSALKSEFSLSSLHSEIDTSILKENVSDGEPDSRRHWECNRQSTIEASLASCQRDIALLQERLITTLLDNAIAGARILPIERPHWENALNENFDETSAALANAAPKLNLTSRTESLPRVNAPLPPDQKQKRILTLVQERMRSTGATYHEAWVQTRSETPSLF